MRKVVILGAAGRDFHNFNVVFRSDPNFKIVAFTATQIPDIANRSYPSSLAGVLYPAGIPILEERDMEKLIQQERIDIACVLLQRRFSPECNALGFQGRRRRGRLLVPRGRTYPGKIHRPRRFRLCRPYWLRHERRHRKARHVSAGKRKWTDRVPWDGTITCDTDSLSGAA